MNVNRHHHNGQAQAARPVFTVRYACTTPQHLRMAKTDVEQAKLEERVQQERRDAEVGDPLDRACMVQFLIAEAARHEMRTHYRSKGKPVPLKVLAAWRRRVADVAAAMQTFRPDDIVAHLSRIGLWFSPDVCSKELDRPEEVSRSRLQRCEMVLRAIPRGCLFLRPPMQQRAPVWGVFSPGESDSSSWSESDEVAPPQRPTVAQDGHVAITVQAEPATAASDKAEPLIPTSTGPDPYFLFF